MPTEILERIVIDLEILAGKPIIRGTRISVEMVIGLMADSWSEEAILKNYPQLKHDDITACLTYARELLSQETIYPSAA